MPSPKAEMAFTDALAGTALRPWMLYILGFILVAIIVLMLLQFKFNLLPSYLDPRPLKSQLASDSLVFWKDPTRTTELRVTAADYGKKKIPYDRYTIMVDMLWLNTRTASADGNTPYRHILHRGTPDIIPSASLDIRQSGGSSSGSSSGGSTAAHGIPSRMNPGILADPVTNDMILFIDTDRGTETYRESVRIPDIPLDIPFTLTLVVMDNFIEVYVNCKLEVTKILSGIPRKTEDAWYGISGSAALAGVAQNLRLWSRGLSAGEIRSLCTSNINIPKPALGAQQCKMNTGPY